MKDGYGRTIDYLRISLTDKCNLRCSYCMPTAGVKRLEHKDVLTIEEIIRTADIFTRLGIRRIRLTGGEPLVRKGVDTVVKSLCMLKQSPELALTTNGVLLGDKLEEYKSFGLTSVNISLDTRSRECFKTITGFDGLDAVERAIDRALALGLTVKLNCVPMKGVNDGELHRIAEYARDGFVDVRYIELMPIGCANEKKGVKSREVLEYLEGYFGKGEEVSGNFSRDVSGTRAAETVHESSSRGPARYVSFKGFKGRVGFISPLSGCFCEDCNRLRLTVDGKLKTCLYYPPALDIKELIRSGAGDEEIKQAVKKAVFEKPERHRFIDNEDGIEDNKKDCILKEERSMVQIGG